MPDRNQTATPGAKRGSGPETPAGATPTSTPAAGESKSASPDMRDMPDTGKKTETGKSDKS
ncbi:MAG: hypothetical protein AB7F35_06855 [Acetobacteraceae bacterium]